MAKKVKTDFEEASDTVMEQTKYANTDVVINMAHEEFARRREARYALWLFTRRVMFVVWVLLFGALVFAPMIPVPHQYRDAFTYSLIVSGLVWGFLMGMTQPPR